MVIQFNIVLCVILIVSIFSICIINNDVGAYLSGDNDPITSYTYRIYIPYYSNHT